MMWKTATIVLVFAAILEQVAVETLRSIIDRKRKQRDGMGGTQDIAIWGMLVGWVLIIAALSCGLMWLLQQLHLI